MQPHIPSIFLANIVASFAIAVVVAAVGFRRKPELMLWASAMAMVGVTYILFSLRGQISDYLSVVLANTLVSSIFAIVAEGFFLFLRKPPPRVLIWGPVALLTLGFIGWMDDFQQRVMLSGAVLATQSFLLAYFVFGNRNAIVGRGRYICGGGALLIGLMQLVRLVATLQNPGDSATFLAPTPMNAASHLLATVTVIVLVVGLLLMTWERDERTLKESETRMRTLFESTSDAMLILDDTGFIDCNQATLQLFGCASKAEFVKLSPADLSPRTQPGGDNSEQLSRQHIATAMRDSRNRFDWVHKRQDTGKHFAAEVLLIALWIDGKHALLAVVRDISERKAQQLELERRVLARTRELATARDEAESANAVKTRFMDNVSHEMRTPMVGILGFAEIARTKVGKVPDETIIGYFDKILASGKRLHSLNESLLSLAQEAWNEQSGIDDKDLQLVMLELLVTESIQMMEKTAASRQQTIAFENQATAEVIVGDEARLRQVMEHLLSNALRFSPDASTVTVRIEDVPAASGDPSAVRIQVIDQGCGVPEKEMRAIFEPFYESSRTATGAGGTGLGLPLCKRIVQRHKGTISVANQPTGGALFEITLPINNGS